jgi:hypothetical protein
METIIKNPNQPHNGRIMAGIIIAIFGAILLINQFFFIPGWLFSWPMWIIGYGVYMGAKYNFKKPIWIWMIVLGTAFLFTENIDDSGRFIWPVSIMGLGTWLVLKQRNKVHTADYKESSFKEL